MTKAMQRGNMKITYCISVFLASLVTFMAQALPGPTSATFDKGALFTVAGYTGASTLSGFPVLVRIAENSPAGFSYTNLHNGIAADLNDVDIAFVGLDGAGLPYEARPVLAHGDRKVLQGYVVDYVVVCPL